MDANTKSLKQQIFEACDSLEAAGERITRDKVREKTGGSDRDLSR